MTLKKMSVAANDIVLNNLVMREKTFKTIPDQLCSVLLNLQFYPTQLGKTPAWIFKSSPRLLCEPMSPPLRFLIPWKFHFSPLFFPGFLEGIQLSLHAQGCLTLCVAVSGSSPALNVQEKGKFAQFLMLVIFFTCPWEQQLRPIISTAGRGIGDKFLLLLTWTDKTFP